MSYKMMAETTRRSLPIFAALLAALLAVRIGALYFNRTDLFFDEAQYWFWSESLEFGYFSKPPLLAWIIRGITDVCGEDPFCIRLASPILHTVTAFFVFLTGRHLYDATVGLWAGLFYATLPGVTMSSGIVSTDVPLLACYSIALFAFIRFIDAPSWGAAILLGLATGAGLMAKYAMAYFIGCAILFLLLTPIYRKLLFDRRLLWAWIIALTLLLPNMLWNLANDSVTLSHTAANAKWGGQLFNPNKGLEFFGAQFAVFGPILFVALLIVLWRSLRKGVLEADRLLLFFSIPVLIIVTTQAFVSRAHANWAAVAYISASVVVAATMLRDRSTVARYASTLLHVGVLGLAVAGTTLAGQFQLPGGIDPFQRVLGWRQAIAGVAGELDRARAAGDAYRLVLADDRAVAAELTYYLRNSGTPVLAWVNGPGFRDHYEQVRPYLGHAGPILFVHHRVDVAHVTKWFEQVEPLKPAEGARGLGARRSLLLYRLDDNTGLPER